MRPNKFSKLSELMKCCMAHFIPKLGGVAKWLGRTVSNIVRFNREGFEYRRRNH